MLRVIYRWKVKPEATDSFIRAWQKASQSIRATAPGGRGSWLLRSRNEPSDFIPMARWESFEHWQSFWLGGPPDPEAYQGMLAAGELVSVEALEEVLIEGVMRDA
jgi:heme-degrading monooxygenase HmoA